MSKVANWGHWIVAAMMGWLGVNSVYFDIIHGEGLLGILIDCALNFGLVWGIVKWAKWAYVLLVVMNGVGAVIALHAYYTLHVAELTRSRMILAMVGGFAMVVWLFLPSVRCEYWNRKRLA
jgi:hypothetical protein